MSSDAMESFTEEQRGLLRALEVGVDSKPPSLLYRISMMLVAGAMVLLPLIYIALIALVAYGVYYHATEHFEPMFRGSGSKKGRLLVYITPIIAGGLAVLFMIKPLFARAVKSDEGVELDPKETPFFHAFVRALCRALGAPEPKHIRVTCDINASASLTHGLFSALSRNLTLTVGLPLAGGFNLTQLTHVLAHEFGHFTQAGGMAFWYIIESINVWFARVVYERDSWDEQIESWCREADTRIAIVLWISRAVIWLTRRILQVLMMIGRVLSSFMGRQMEYDADALATRLCGAESLAATHERLTILMLANNGAYADLETSWREQRLPDNLPYLVLANEMQIPEKVLAQVEAESREETTGFFDTHPATSDRIRRARELNHASGFSSELPATILIENYEEICLRASLAYYREVLGVTPKPEQLQSVGELVEDSLSDQEAFKSIGRFSQNCTSAMRPLAFGEAPPASVGLDEIRLSLESLRMEVVEGAAEYRKVLTVYDKLDDAVI
ncbi:MAG: M48 family metallopeptidase, partial [Planctomycetota bacterium]